MAATTFYQGQAERVTITQKDVNGTAIPHASILELRYILRHENGDSLKKFKKTAPTGWNSMTQEAAAGQYTFEIEEKDSKTWPPGMIYLEWFIKIDNSDFVDGYKPMGVYELFIMTESNYAKE